MVISNTKSTKLNHNGTPPRKRRILGESQKSIERTTKTPKTGSSNPDKQAKRQEQNWFTFKSNGCAVSFQRVTTADFEERYLCTCMTSFSSSEAVRVHVNGTRTASKRQDPCPDMAALIAILVNKKHIYRKLIRRMTAFEIASLKHMPGGFSLKVDIDEDSDVPEGEQPGLANDDVPCDQ
ncbi:hypothetical protein BGX34_000810 [Mortierella sp. NVP85]|nr:hypothetical protein BGX34_000810 [Mortierella sp. NVP85]